MTAPAPFRRRVIINTLSTALGNGWAMVVALASVPLLLHGLGTEAFGLWVLIQTFSAVTGWFSLADFGFGAAITRAVAAKLAVDDHQGVGRVVGSGLAIFGGVSILAGAAFALIGPVALTGLFKIPASLRGDLRAAATIYGIQIAAELTIEGIEACAEGLQRVDVSRFLDAVRRTAVVAATAAVALSGGGLRGVAIAGAITATTTTLFGLAVVLRRLPVNELRISGTEARSLFAYGRMIAVLRPLGVIQRTMDRMIVGIVIGPEAVAVVEVATQVLNGADAVLSATSYAVAPSASWLAARDDRPSLRELLVRGSRYSVLATWIVSAAAIGLAHPFVHIWVGSRYASAPGLIAVALAGEILVAPCQVGSNLLLGLGRAKVILWSVVLALAVNLVGSTILVATVGIVGTFIGTAAGNVILIPTLLRTALRDVGETGPAFASAVISRAVPPAIAMFAATFGASLLPISAAWQLALGGALGSAAATLVVLRFTLQAGEARSLVDSVRGRGRAPAERDVDGIK